MIEQDRETRIESLYKSYKSKLDLAKSKFNRRYLTLSEKILFSHIYKGKTPESVTRGQTFLQLQPDRVAMQDATAQMAMLQFMQAQKNQVALPSTVHCDHLIRAQNGSAEDLARAITENKEVYEFLESASQKYGLGFWKPGSGIIHQVVFENYAFPGGLMIGTDSHTPNAGGLGMIAVGVGGADAAEVMAGFPWEILMPKIIGVKLTGTLGDWVSPKDVILSLLGILTTSGGTNKMFEYFGPGVQSISATGRGTITNMGAELGATTSLFPFDKNTDNYLRATKRSSIADLALQYKNCLRPDPEVEEEPTLYYDEFIEIDLSTLKPSVVGPHRPDRYCEIDRFAQEIEKEGYPENVSAALIGSCTNSSYEDLEKVASIAREAIHHGLKVKAPLYITPGSNQIYETIKQNGQLEVFEKLGATVLSNACGPCIGNWDRTNLKQNEPNVIFTSFNRNFPKRNDGNAGTLAFITSPEIVLAQALSGKTGFNPLRDTIDNIKLTPPTADDLPSQGFVFTEEGYLAPAKDGAGMTVKLAPNSSRLELLEPFAPWNNKDYTGLVVLVKTKGQTTTDHISPAGKDWLPLRGHLSGISHNMLLGAVDADTGKTAEPSYMNVCGKERGTSPWALKAMDYKKNGVGTVVIGDSNYGEGSSREHAAMSPRLLGVKAVITRSFARIHETNLKKQGILPLTFHHPDNYDKVQKSDRIDLIELSKLAPGRPVKAFVHKSSGEVIELLLNHSLNIEQIEWFKAGSAMNIASLAAKH